MSGEPKHIHKRYTIENKEVKADKCSLWYTLW
jgi:hypothetical protein